MSFTLVKMIMSLWNEIDVFFDDEGEISTVVRNINSSSMNEEDLLRLITDIRKETSGKGGHTGNDDYTEEMSVAIAKSWDEYDQEQAYSYLINTPEALNELFNYGHIFGYTKDLKVCRWIIDRDDWYHWEDMAESIIKNIAEKSDTDIQKLRMIAEYAHRSDCQHTLDPDEMSDQDIVEYFMNPDEFVPRFLNNLIAQGR